MTIEAKLVIANTTKLCTKCSTHRPIEQFSCSSRAKDKLCIWCKVCSQESQKQWRQQNRERVASHNRARYEANKDKYAAKNKAYREMHREKLKEHSRRYYQENREKMDAKTATKRRENPELARSYCKTWRKNNLDKIAAKVARRKAFERNAYPNWADRTLIDEIYAEADKLRRLTGELLEVDHIVPIIGPLVQGLSMGNVAPRKRFVGPLIPLVYGFHCQQNMRVISARENRVKNNKWWPDMPLIKI